MIEDYIYVTKKEQKPFSGVCNYYDRYGELNGEVFISKGFITKTIAYDNRSKKSTCTHTILEEKYAKEIERIHLIRCIEKGKPYYVVNIIMNTNVKKIEAFYKKVMQKLKARGIFATLKKDDLVIIKLNNLKKEYFKISIMYPDF